MKAFTTLLLIFSFLTIHAQGTDSAYANGQVKYSGTETNGIYHKYHANGQVMETTHYANGLKHGEHFEYFEYDTNGVLIKTLLYHNGNLIQ